MPFPVYPAEAVFENRDFETGLQKVFGRVADAIFGCDTYHVNRLCAKKLQHLRQALASSVAAFESGILLLCGIAPFIECKLFLNERLQVVVDLAFAGAGYAVRGPWAALFDKGTMVGGMVVADEESGYAGFPLQQGLCGGDRLQRMFACQGSSREEAINLVDYNYSFFHIQSL